MDATEFGVRKEELLNECEVAPQVFARVMPRLERFMKPFVDLTVALFKGWITREPSTTQTWARISGLQPGASYLMLVRAHNSHGISESSPVSNYITTLASDSDITVDSWTRDNIERNINSTRVNLQQVEVLTSNALNITWKVRNPV